MTHQTLVTLTYHLINVFHLKTQILESLIQSILFQSRSHWVNDLNISDPNCKAAIKFIHESPIYDSITDPSNIILTNLIKCVACKPSYKPIEFDSGTIQIISSINTIDGIFISKCEKIQNCDLDEGYEWYNSCSQCAQGYLWEYNPLSRRIINSIEEIDYTSCIKNVHNDLDCEALDSIGQCGLCKAGFEIDEFGICQLHIEDNCEFLYTVDNEELLFHRARYFQRDSTS